MCFVAICIATVLLCLNVFIIIKAQNQIHKSAIEKFTDKGIRQGVPKLVAYAIAYAIVYWVLLSDALKDIRDIILPLSNHRL